MAKFNFKKTVGNVQLYLSKHSPEILTGLGITGMITTTVLAVKATPKALALIEKEKDIQNSKLAEEASANREEYCPQVTKLKSIDTIKTTWKCYLPSVILGTASIGCLIGASSVHSRRNALLATAYKISESALTEYKEKVIETIGEKKEQAIRDEINKDRIEQNPVSKNEVIITGKGDVLCYDHYGSGRYFKSDVDKIKKAVNEINSRMLCDGYVSLNEFYDEIGLSGTDIGDTVGWSVDDGLIEVYFSALMSDENVPCLAIDYKKPPKHGYNKFF